MPKQDPTVLDIKILSGNDGVILIKGTPEEAAPVLLAGIISLNVSGPTRVKSVSLKLTGRLTYNVPITPPNDPNSATSKRTHLTADKWIYQYKWDDIEIDKYFKGLYENYQNKTPIDSSVKHVIDSKELHSLARPKSTTSLISLKTTKKTFQKKKYHTLVKGNYEFPFNTILPGNLNETVDGLPNTYVNYYLEAIVERTTGKADLYCRKFVRIVRTITPDITDISETVNVTETWPDKLFYSISIPAKAIAIGSDVPLNISIIPLRSNLKLDSIRVSLYERADYCSNGVRSKIERVVSRLKVKDPEKRLIKMINDDKFQERWDLNLAFKVPANLSKCTQDCQILSSLKVSHRFKFVVNIINEAGHISKLKANIPISLFISEFIPLSIKKIKSNANLTSVLSNIRSHDITSDSGETIFRRGSVGNIYNENCLPVTAIKDLLSPPEYERHVFDRLFDSETDFENTAQEPSCALLDKSLADAPYYDISTEEIFQSTDSDVIRRRSNDASYYSEPDMTSYGNKVSFIDQPSSIPNEGFLLKENYTLNSLSEDNSITNIPTYEGSIHSRIEQNKFPPSYTKNDDTEIPTFPEVHTQNTRPARHRFSSISSKSPFVFHLDTNYEVEEYATEYHSDRRYSNEESIYTKTFKHNFESLSPSNYSLISCPKRSGEIERTAIHLPRTLSNTSDSYNKKTIDNSIDIEPVITREGN